MSFSYDAKAEICRGKIENKSSAVSECYGIVLYCQVFSPELIRITTSNGVFALRLPRLFRKAFGLGFDRVPEEGASGRMVFEISDAEKIRTVYEAFGYDPASVISHHINLGVLEEDGCKADFMRGAFLAGGSVTDPEKGFHLEFSTSHATAARETVALLIEMGFAPKLSSRSVSSLIYFKQADGISDLLTVLGATGSAMAVITARVEREMRNTVTRQINCDSANADKTVSAAQEQLAAIKAYAAKNGLDSLPDPLKDAALLRIANPAASLADLARLSYPQVSKSCLSHRLKKIMSLASEEEIL